MNDIGTKITIGRRSIQAKITLTAKDWELCTLVDPEACDNAAESINKWIEQLLEQGVTDESQYLALLHPYARLGACDSEPIWVMRQVLEHAGVRSLSKVCDW